MGDFEEALANFNDTLQYLRGNNNIDYEQLGLKFKLFACEVLFNRGLCYIYLSQIEAGMQDLMFAAKEKVVPDHDVIDEAIKEQAEVCTSASLMKEILTFPGLHCLLHTRRHSLSSQRSESQESKSKGLPRQSTLGSGHGPQPDIHRFHWLRIKTNEQRRRCKR